MTIWNEYFKYIQKLKKKIINLSQTMARVTIMTIQNGQWKIIVFRKNQFIIPKMLRLTIEIITHLQENKYMKSPKSAMCPQMDLMN
jgi:hypothetical protein